MVVKDSRVVELRLFIIFVVNRLRVQSIKYQDDEKNVDQCF